uniref:Uncharacterized protein n=1 Tax=Hordeum vulgare subsp. vulgare TaxID=112509 RepID=A0A8I6XFE7_HORVV
MRRRRREADGRALSLSACVRPYHTPIHPLLSPYLIRWPTPAISLLLFCCLCVVVHLLPVRCMC